MRDLTIPTEIRKALDDGAALAISVSGGKDSQAMATALVQWTKLEGYWGRNEIFAVHADLGRAEWHQTPEHVERTMAELGLELHVVQRVRGDMLQRIEQRRETLEGTGSPFWMSSQSRYCTSELKRDPINSFLRQWPLVISAEGIRADESSKRAKKPCWEPRSRINTQTRDAFTWNPILQWSEADVWEAMGTTSQEITARRELYAAGDHDSAFDGWVGHAAYVIGNDRLSCSLCMLAGRGDLLNGARHNPEYFEALLAMEIESGFTFKQDVSLVSIAAELASQDAEAVR